MSYTPIYMLIALAVIGGLGMLALRFLGRRRAARHQRQHDAYRARNAETWARRNGTRPD